MAKDLLVRVYRQRSLRHTISLTGKLQIGRQRPGEQNPFHFDAQSQRLIIAAIDDKLVSREHMELELISAGSQETEDENPRIRISNLSRKRSINVDMQGRLGPEKTIEVNTPTLVSFEDFAVRVEPDPTEGGTVVHSLEQPTMAPGQFPETFNQTILQATKRQSYAPDELMRWLSEMMAVLQRAAGTADFMAQAVDAVDRIVGLDAIAALRLEDGKWRIEASKSDPVNPSRTILRQIEEKRSTVFHLPAAMPAAVSLQGIRALVASPILDSAGELIGALYGARYSTASVAVPQISELEATMVEVIACSAAAGIAREQQQHKALQARILFEQYFSPQLARELEANPALLDAQDADISVLFCDIVGFSSVSHRIGSRMTMQWISEVMECLSDAIERNGGVVVDYIGDEVMAMWGAPKAQADHAIKACLASEELMNCKQQIDSVWHSRTGQPVDFRIGICSGKASVGNTGSIRRNKYGPLGNTVNLASRLQSAAKQFGVKRAVSARTAEAVHGHASLVCRPLGTARFVNISEPFAVFELGTQRKPGFADLAERFEAITHLLQHADWAAAKNRLHETAKRFPDDTPTQLLLKRVENGEVDPKCIWPLETK